jgi:hypothetical protein
MKPAADTSSLQEAALSSEYRLELELLLLCTRPCIDEQAEQRINQLLLQDVDWLLLISVARAHGVIPLLYRAVRYLQLNAMPTEIRHELQREFHAWGMAVHVLVKELREVLKLLEENGIPAIPFKGPALAVYVYGDPANRKPGDLDILINQRDFFKTRDLLMQRGYTPRIKLEQESHYLHTRGASAFVRNKFNIDLHWSLEQKIFDSFPFSWKFDDDEVWERACSLTLAGTEVRTLSPEDLLSFLCVHGSKDSWHSLYLICDVAALIHAHPELDWQWMMDRAETLRSERILYLGLCLAGQLMDAPLPDKVWKRIHDNEVVGKLAHQVCTCLFKPSGRSSSPQHHHFRTKMLERPHKKMLYLLLRGMRKISKMNLLDNEDEG